MVTYVVVSGCHQKKVGRGDWIRTSDPLLPKQMRYQTAPLPAPFPPPRPYKRVSVFPAFWQVRHG